MAASPRPTCGTVTPASARVDGPPGGDAELAAVYSLDPSFTPVRVTTHGGTTRIPRDAFGEGLLQLGDGPGLHGGMMAGGRVHYRARSLDPRIGAYTSPDPWPGDAAESAPRWGLCGPAPLRPRTERLCRLPQRPGRARRSHRRGVDRGRQAAAQPQHAHLVVAAHAGYDVRARPAQPVPGRLSPVSRAAGSTKRAFPSRYLGSFGFRYDPVGLEALNINVGRAWTYQHIVWARASGVHGSRRCPGLRAGGGLPAAAARLDPAHRGGPDRR